MAEKWTPGPWGQHGTLVIADRPDDGGTICQVSEVRKSRYAQHHEPEWTSPDHNEIYANARLIAAAPDMHTALIEAEACMSIVEPRSDKAEYLRILGVVRAALAKAKGE